MASRVEGPKLLKQAPQDVVCFSLSQLTLRTVPNFNNISPVFDFVMAVASTLLVVHSMTNVKRILQLLTGGGKKSEKAN